MIYASKTIAMAGFAISLALPSFAEAPTDTSPMSCAEFTAMDSTGMAVATHSLRFRAGGSARPGARIEDPTAVEAPAATTAGVPSSKPAEGTSVNNLQAAPPVETEAPAATTAGVASSEPAVPPVSETRPNLTTAEMSTEELVSALVSACQGHPDMMLMDVMG